MTTSRHPGGAPKKPLQLELFADGARAIASTKRPRPPVTEAQLLRELADTRREVRNLVVIGLRPDVSEADRELIHNLERSARVGVKLLLKALAYHREQQRNGHG